MSPLPNPIPGFAPDSPIPLVILTHLLASTVAAMPGCAAADPAARTALLAFVQFAIAGYDPRNALEAMLAATAVTLRAQSQEAFRLCGEPGMPEALARRHRAQGTSLGRLLDQTERRLLRSTLAG